MVHINTEAGAAAVKRPNKRAKNEEFVEKPLAYTKLLVQESQL